MDWLLLFLAGGLETCWAVGLKFTVGFSRLWPSLWTLGCMAASFYLLSLAMRTLPLGTAYAVWTGIGAVGTVIVGVLFLGEPCTVPRLVSIGCIVAGILGLKLFS